MIHVYFFIKCLVRWSENFVRFEKSYGNWLRQAKFCEILSHSVRYGMNEECLTRLFSIKELSLRLNLKISHNFAEYYSKAHTMFQSDQTSIIAITCSLHNLEHSL